MLFRHFRQRSAIKDGHPVVSVPSHIDIDRVGVSFEQFGIGKHDDRHNGIELNLFAAEGLSLRARNA